jgi:hypothetical protein
MSMPEVCRHRAQLGAQQGRVLRRSYLEKRHVPAASSLLLVLALCWPAKCAAQDADHANASSSNEFATMATTDGPPGLFTVESGDVLAKGTLLASLFSNKFSRAPGGVTILNNGFTVAVGVTKHIMLYGNFEPDVHMHVDLPSQLSLWWAKESPGTYPPYEGAFASPAAPDYPALPPGNNPVYVEDYPFAAFQSTDRSPVTLGIKANFWSDDRGDPVSVSLRNDFILPTRTSLYELTNYGPQTGTYADTVSVAISRHLKRWHGILLAVNIGYNLPRDPWIATELSHHVAIEEQDVIALAGRQLFGGGVDFLTTRRVQLLMEFNNVFFQESKVWGEDGNATQDWTHDPRNPVDGIWGVRFYATKTLGIELGYRYMINLYHMPDRNGFVINVGKSFHL